MGFSMPWASVLPGAPGHLRLRILTCNVDGGHYDAPALGALIVQTKPDVVALQEWSGENEPGGIFDANWHCWQYGGLLVASRHAIQATEALRAPGGYRHLAMRCVLKAPGGDIVFCNLHLDTPREGITALLDMGLGGLATYEENLGYRLEGSETASQWLARTDGPLLIVGDFNMPVDSPVYRAYWSHYTNAFSSAGLGWGHTKFTRLIGCRIDHALAGPGWQFRRCLVGPDVGSDHVPVIAEVRWVGRPSR
jgi:vancomycin resistance protein VanJ